MKKLLLGFLIGGGLLTVYGVYAAFAPFSISQGGTSTSTPPAYGDVFVGQSNGTWKGQATSTLGITVASSAVPDLIQLTTGGTKYYVASSTATDNLTFRFNNGFVSSASSTVVGDLSVRHISGNSGVPALSSCGGGTPTITGSDLSGKVVIGTGVQSSCVLTFANSFAVAPACVANDESAILLVRAVSTQTTLTLSVATTFPSDTISYICTGN